ncbi:hypothetical protein SAMN05519103_06641 [Rhizobiales bacterium GAS113]|nr:hypothetical protein SAMN05519103_06641 [Rhizobiales bacterium GAS113]
MIKLLAICVLLVAQTALAEAAQPPRFNINSTCRQAQPLTGDKSVYQSCVSEENQARKKLTKTWSTFKSSARRSCVQETEIGGAPSYVDLLTCLQLDKDAGALPQ